MAQISSVFFISLFPCLCPQGLVVCRFAGNICWMDERGNPRLLAYSQIVFLRPSAFPVISLLPCSLLGAREFIQQLLLGDCVRMHVRGGLGEGSILSCALKSQALLPSCWVSAGAGVRQESERKDSQEGQRVWLVRRGRHSLQWWELSPEHCLFPTLLLSAQNRQAEFLERDLD